MKVNLAKEWFENRIRKEDDLDVTAGIPSAEESSGVSQKPDQGGEGGFVGPLALGALVQCLRRERRLSIDQLASEAQMDALEIIGIERDPRYVPKPRSVHQLASFFGLPDRPLLKLSNITTVHSEKLREAATRFAANSTAVMELSREERAALAEFVEFLSSHGTDEVSINDDE